MIFVINFIFQLIKVYLEIPFGKGLYHREIQSIDLKFRSIDWFLYGVIFYWKVFPEAYTKPSRASRAENFVKMVNDFRSLAIFTESYVSDVWVGSEYASVFLNKLQILIQEIDLN